MIHRFRQEVYQSFEQRGDAGLDLIDALSSAESVESPVWQSESPLFRRGFSSIYDVLKHGRLSLRHVRRALYRHQPEDAESIAGYEVYAVDCTEHPHPEAETLPDRTQSKKGRNAPKVIGHRSSWLVRVVSWRPSWCMPQDVERVESRATDSEVAAEQVKRLDKQGASLKAVVADSLYCNAIFLGVFLVVTTVVGLVRVRSNQVLYEEPPDPKPNQRGRPRKHGAKFKLSDPKRAPDRTECTTILGQTIRLSAWHGLHFYKLPALVGLVLMVEFLKADGTPRFKRPLYLFWTGPQTTALADLCRMYLWRFAIEHMFRFLKQHMGLNTSRSPALDQQERWLWYCALAYAQLLLIRTAVAQQRPPWHRSCDALGQPRTLTARQTQRNALAFLLDLGTPALGTQPAGKGHGRPHGYRPKPRPRHQVIKKGKKQAAAS
jgi:hypothetical protein